MAMVSSNLGFSPRPKLLQVSCRKREKNRDNYDPYKVIEITPPPKSLGVRCFPSNLHCGDSVTIEGQTYTISAVTHRYQLRKGKYEPSEKRLDVLSTARYILNLGPSGGFITTVYPSGEPRRLTEAFRHPPGHYIVIYQR